MKKLLMFVLLAFSFSSLSVHASELIKRSEVNDFKEIGAISVSGIRGTTDDAIHKLIKKADSEGASYLYITSLGTSGDSSLFHATAEIFK